MTLKPGDKVRFLNEVGGGIVRKVTKDLAYVETSDGFEIPTAFSQLIKVESDNSVVQPDKVEREIKQPVFSGMNGGNFREEPDSEEDFQYIEGDEVDIITNENCTLNILLGILPVKTKGYAEPRFSVYLISDCAYRLLYTFSVVKDNFCYGRKAGEIEDDTKMLVAEFEMHELRDIQSFKINCIFYKKGIYLPHEPLMYEYKIDAFAMSDPSNWAANDFFDEKAIIINLTEESLIYEIERMVSENEEKFVIQKKKKDASRKPVVLKSTDEGTEEVDLHIEQLVDDYTSLSSGEILDIQMSRFNIALDGAIRNKNKRIVFIHGVGNGKLKYEIRKTLDSKYSRLKYQDASFKEYGYGATMVMIK